MNQATKIDSMVVLDLLKRLNSFDFAKMTPQKSRIYDPLVWTFPKIPQNIKRIIFSHVTVVGRLNMNNGLDLDCGTLKTVFHSKNQ